MLLINYLRCNNTLYIILNQMWYVGKSIYSGYICSDISALSFYVFIKSSLTLYWGPQLLHNLSINEYTWIIKKNKIEYVNTWIDCEWKNKWSLDELYPLLKQMNCKRKVENDNLTKLIFRFYCGEVGIPSFGAWIK